MNLFTNPNAKDRRRKRSGGGLAPTRRVPCRISFAISHRIPLRSPRGFTLVELLIVVAIMAILSAIGLSNFRMASERALKAAGASNLHTLATGLQTYLVDYGTLPPADREAGPFMSHGHGPIAIGNGPAAGGSWDGVPWLLVEHGYVSHWETLFCPKYRRQFRGKATLRGDHPRYHNFRYAYNSSALSTGGHAGGDGALMSGTTWIARDLYVAPQHGWYARSYPNYPADYDYPWGEGEWERKVEQALMGDLAVRELVGGKNYPPGTEP